jgi:hypothetical protein
MTPNATETKKPPPVQSKKNRRRMLKIMPGPNVVDFGEDWEDMKEDEEEDVHPYAQDALPYELELYKGSPDLDKWVEAYVLARLNETDFIIRLKESEEPLKKLQADMKEFYEPYKGKKLYLKPSRVKENTFVMFKNKDRFCRAAVLNPDPYGMSCDVFLVDYGIEKRSVPMGHLLLLEERFEEPPIACWKVRLDNCGNVAFNDRKYKPYWDLWDKAGKKPSVQVRFTGERVDVKNDGDRLYVSMNMSIAGKRYNAENELNAIARKEKEDIARMAKETAERARRNDAPLIEW